MSPPGVRDGDRSWDKEARDQGSGLVGRMDGRADRRTVTDGRGGRTDGLVGETQCNATEEKNQRKNKP